MNNDLNLTEEEYKQINAVEEDDSIKINNRNLRRVSNNLLIYFFIIFPFFISIEICNINV
jgi:hypothetical protein